MDLIPLRVLRGLFALGFRLLGQRRRGEDLLQRGFKLAFRHPEIVGFCHDALNVSEISGKSMGALCLCHSRYEYARHNADGTVSHVNTCESFFSLLKRAVFGSWHCISAEHLSKYASEFEFRWNTRKTTDGERMVTFMPRIAGKRLMYRQPAN